MMTNERPTKIINFMTPPGRGSCARVWPYRSYSKNVLFVYNSSLLTGIDQTNKYIELITKVLCKLSIL